MSGTDRPESGADESVLEAVPACVALVPVTPPAQRWQGPYRAWSPNSIFVTHLIATAEHVPQTRGLRRASFADAQSAYHANQTPARGAGSRTRQII
jgi:hypothetical protein